MRFDITLFSLLALASPLLFWAFLSLSRRVTSRFTGTGDPPSSGGAGATTEGCPLTRCAHPELCNDWSQCLAREWEKSCGTQR